MLAPPWGSPTGPHGDPPVAIPAVGLGRFDDVSGQSGLVVSAPPVLALSGPVRAQAARARRSEIISSVNAGPGVIQPKVRSTTQRRGTTWNPLAPAWASRARSAPTPRRGQVRDGSAWSSWRSWPSGRGSPRSASGSRIMTGARRNQAFSISNAFSTPRAGKNRSSLSLRSSSWPRRSTGPCLVPLAVQPSIHPKGVNKPTKRVDDFKGTGKP